MRAAGVEDRRWVSVAVASLVVLALGPMAGIAGAANPIVQENNLPGDSTWQEAVNADSYETNPPISGYASATSVRPGSRIAFHVDVPAPAHYRVEIVRLGWYGGAGGRLMTCIDGSKVDPSCIDDRASVTQPTAPRPDRFTGELDAGWRTTDELRVPASWVSGYYVAIFHLTTGNDSGQTNFAPFIVQAPVGDDAQILVQVPTNTWQAYNPWGGEDLYTSPQAIKVSFNRPYAHRLLFKWEYPLVRFLERHGYDVSYATDDDVDRDPSILLHHRLDIVAGHSEYWTMAMRDGWDAARDSGVNLAFMGANTGYWQVRYQDHYRTMVGYKQQLSDPVSNPELRTIMFRSLLYPMPECELVGGAFKLSTWLSSGSRNYTVTAAGAADPWFAGSGLKAGTVIPGIVGYEMDTLVPGCHVPPLTTLLHFSGGPVQIGGPPAVADATRYRACSGAEVFNAGSLQFSLALDSWRDPTLEPPNIPVAIPPNPQLEHVMTSAINDMLVSHVPHPGPPMICVPSPRFELSPAAPRVGQRIRFRSTATDPYGFIGGLRWRIGSRRARGAVVVRTFSRPGHYPVTLKAIDTSGASAVFERVITVRPATRHQVSR